MCTAALPYRELTRATVTTLVIALLSACDGATSPHASATTPSPKNKTVLNLEPISAKELATLASRGEKGRIVRPYEEQFHAIAARVPSFAGFALAPDGALHVLGTDPVALDAIAALAEPFARDVRAVARGMGLRGGLVKNVARFRFVDLSDWRDSATTHLLGTNGVVSVDLDELRNRVVIGIGDNADTTGIHKGLDDRGVPRDAVVVMPDEQIAPLYGPRLDSESIVMLGGIAAFAQGQGTCSLGPTLAIDGVARITTASHCTSVFGAASGEPLWQGSRVVGNEINDPPFRTLFGKFPARWSDWTVFSGNGVAGILTGHIARTTGDRSVTIDFNNPYFFMHSAESGAIAQGWFIYKQGWATGWTYGTVVQSCTDRQVQSTSIWLICQFRTDALANPGDSGGPVWAPVSGGQNMLVGIVQGETSSGAGMIFSGFRGFEEDMFGARFTGRIQVN
jgi:hypothetical protein